MAWKFVKYEKIHYGMKEEFEIDSRFEQIEFKLNLIQQNAKFFLEVLQSQKSNSLEWIIVVLIGLECVIMCIDMSGMGQTLFQYMSLPSWLTAVIDTPTAAAEAAATTTTTATPQPPPSA